MVHLGCSPPSATDQFSAWTSLAPAPFAEPHICPVWAQEQQRRSYPVAQLKLPLETRQMSHRPGPTAGGRFNLSGGIANDISLIRLSRNLIVACRCLDLEPVVSCVRLSPVAWRPLPASVKMVSTSRPADLRSRFPQIEFVGLVGDFRRPLLYSTTKLRWVFFMREFVTFEGRQSFAATTSQVLCDQLGAPAMRWVAMPEQKRWNRSFPLRFCRAGQDLPSPSAMPA